MPLPADDILQHWANNARLACLRHCSRIGPFGTARQEIEYLLTAGSNILSSLSYEDSLAVNNLKQLAIDLHTAAEEAAKAQKKHPSICTSSEIVDQIKLLQEDFEDVAVDIYSDRLTVNTGNVILSDDEDRCFDFGPFSISIESNWVNMVHPDIKVTALLPQPCPGKALVVHPNVIRKEICLGEAKVPVKIALAEGRFLDALTLIKSVLFTWEPDSEPHAELLEWLEEETESVFCEGCESRIYSSRRTDDCCYDSDCIEIFCSSACAVTCERCNRLCCGAHSSSCVGCNSEMLCMRCHDRSHGRCIACEEERTCQRCGCFVHPEEDIQEVDDSPICTNCAKLCTSCNKYFLLGDVDADCKCEDCRTPEADVQPTGVAEAPVCLPPL